MALTLMGIYWIGFALAYAVLLRGLPHGMGIVIDVLVGVFLGDTGAYLGGHMFGRRPLARRISPGKTVEGLLIGMAFAVLGVWIAGRYRLVVGNPRAGARARRRGRRARGRSVRVVRQARGGHEGLRAPVRRPRGALDRLDGVLFAAVVGYLIWAAYV